MNFGRRLPDSGEYAVEYLASVLRDARRIDSTSLLDIRRKIEWLAQHVREVPHHSLEGRKFRDRYKLRVGDYRVIYSIDSRHEVITIELIGHRSKIYKER